MNKLKQAWLDELALFIVEGNQNTWAAEGIEVDSERKGYKELEYSRGLWRVRDSYTAYFRAPGMTTVYFKEKTAWTMAYGGTGQTEGFEGIVKSTFMFLKKALMRVTPELPFRGPENFEEGEWKYNLNLRRRDITDFFGEECIHRGTDLVFSQIVFGGIAIHKDSERRPVYPWQF